MKQRRKTYEVTVAGLVFVGVTIFVFLAAMNSGSNPLYFAFGLMIGALLVAVAFGGLMLRKIEVVRIAPDHAAVGQPTAIQYRLTNHRRVFPAFAIRVGEARWLGQLRTAPQGYCLHLGTGESATVASHLVPERRGVLDLRDVRVACAFPFGFLNRSVYHPAPERIVVYPRIGLLNRQIALRCRESATTGPMTSEVRGGNDEFYGLREYRSGDNVKAIHWRRTARTGELMIREMTSDAPPQLVLVLNLRSWRTVPDGPEAAERAIEFAAALVCYGYLENFAVGLSIIGLDPAPFAQPRRGREQRARLLEALASVDPESIRPDPVKPPAARAKSRAEWVIITLAAADPIDDTAPPGSPRILLPLDQPESRDWVLFPDAPAHEPVAPASASTPGQAP